MLRTPIKGVAVSLTHWHDDKHMKIPTKIQLHKKTRILDIDFNRECFSLPAEFLRVHSPSAEVQGHGPGQEVLQYGKKFVAINKIEAAGNYGLRLYFDDGHNSGIFTWSLLEQLGRNQAQLQAQYQEKLHANNLTREPNAQVVNILPNSSA
ncbi:MAG: gamma-butyrobetaine hydroxylase-like domain-containing protein [Cellvibrionaceae bacterium]